MRLTIEIFDKKYYTMTSDGIQRILLEETPDKYKEALEKAMDILEEAVNGREMLSN